MEQHTVTADQLYPRPTTVQAAEADQPAPPPLRLFVGGAWHGQRLPSSDRPFVTVHSVEEQRERSPRGWIITGTLVQEFRYDLGSVMLLGRELKCYAASGYTPQELQQLLATALLGPLGRDLWQEAEWA